MGNIGTIGLIQQIVIFGFLGWLIYSLTTYFVRSLKNKIIQTENSMLQQNQKLHHFKTTYGEPLNLLLIILSIVYLIFYIQAKVGFEQTKTYQDIPAWIMAFLPGLIGLIILVWNVGAKLLQKPKLRRYGFQNELPYLSIEHNKKQDRQRKFHHILGWVFLASVFITGNILITLNLENSEYERIFVQFWGDSTGSQMMDSFFQPENMPLGQAIIVMWMYGELLVLLTFEITRLSQKVIFPFHKQVQRTMKYKELETFAAFSHYAAGYFIAATVLPPMLFIACFGIITFADPAASTIGIRYGGKLGTFSKRKHFNTKFSWNGKSVEGLLAGMIMTFLSVIPFAGPIYAIIAVIGYIFVDLLTTKPLAISDNIFIPLITTLFFLILSQLGIKAVNVFGL